MRKNKWVSILVVLVLVCTLVFTTTVTASAATMKLNKKSASVYVGSTVTLKVLNTSSKVTWTTSDKSIATVKSTGTKSAKVTAKKAGKVTITAKVGEKKFKCTVTVKKKNYYSEGMYKVGKDIKAGTYVLIESDSFPYMEVTSSSTGDFDDIITNAMFKNRHYITLEDEQYIKIQDCKMYPLEKAPKVKLEDKETLEEGMYAVGTDIPAGEYTLLEIEEDSFGGAYYCVKSDCSAETLDNIVTNDLFETNAYVTVQDGQYLEFTDCELVLNVEEIE